MKIDTSGLKYDYEGAKAITTDFNLVERLAMFALFAFNAYLLWSFVPGVAGAVLGGGMAVFVAIMVIGEVYRQVMLRL